jgi:hypothetical protein
LEFQEAHKFIAVPIISQVFNESRTLAHEDVGRTITCDEFRAFIAQSMHIDVVREMLPGTEQDRPDSEMKLVDQAGPQILPNSGYAAAEADVTATCCRGRWLQSGMNAFGDKAKLRTSWVPNVCFTGTALACPVQDDCSGLSQHAK